MTDSTSVVLLTAPGRGAVATLVVDGDRATELVGQRFAAAAGRPLSDFPWGAIVFGHWLARGQREELIVCRIDPRRVEIHCHGGTAAAQRIVESLEQLGARSTPWGRWLRESGQSPIAIAALECLQQARTERTAAILLDQYRGALQSAIGQIVADLTGNRLETARARLGALVERAGVGLHLAHPFKVVLAGQPNAGKSSLINAMVGYERALVFAEPGTTRDVVTACTAIDGWPVELADTAAASRWREINWPKLT
jgi:tRNA modification GTPase